MQRLARIAWRTAAQCANTARPVTEVCKLFRHRASSTSLPKTRGCHRPQRKCSWPNVATLVMGSISKICAMVFSPGASLVSAPALPLKKMPFRVAVFFPEFVDLEPFRQPLNVHVFDSGER
jgi:hypothetical protein